MESSTAAPTAAPPRRWYGHGWNRPFAWRLLYSITPRLPRFIRWPLLHAVAFLCFLCMPKERTAARANLARVTGARGVASLRLAYRLFHNFGRYLVAYTRMKSFDTAREGPELKGAAEVVAALQAARAEGRGVLLLTMHLGQWDMGLRLLNHEGVPVHIVMLSEDPKEVTRFTDAMRALPYLHVHQMGSSALLAVTLLSALRRGEFVAVQGDRAVGSSVMRIPFFGKEASLPTGPVQLAIASGAPMVPVFTLLGEGDSFEIAVQPPLRFARSRDGDDRASLRAAMEQVRDRMEEAARRWPDQWFNFFDLWAPPLETPTSHASSAPRRGWAARLRNLLLHRHTEPSRLAIAVAIGVFIALTPFYGLHTLLVAAVCWPLRLNIAAAILATQIANPLFAPGLIAASAWLGSRLGPPSPAAGDTSWWDMRNPLFYTAWLRGGIVLGLALGLVCGAVTWAVAKRLRRKHAHV